MYCPKCGILLHLNKESKETDMFFNKSKWPIPPEGFFQCKGCGLLRPDVWWDVLQLDVDTEIKFIEQPTEEVPEELAGHVEAPWGD